MSTVFITKNETQTFINPLKNIPALIVSLWSDREEIAKRLKSETGETYVGIADETKILQAVHDLNLLFDYADYEEGITDDKIAAYWIKQHSSPHNNQPDE